MTVGEATEIGLEDVPTERLEAQITELAGHLAAAECRWLELVAEFDRRKGYEAWGCISCAYWLSWHCGLDLRSARDKVRVGRSLEDLRLVREKFAAGSISYSKVRAITRVATPATEEDLVMLAESSTTEHVERIVRGVPAGDQPRGGAARGAGPSTRTQGDVLWDDDGSGVMYGRGSRPKTSAVVKAALQAAREELSPDDGSAEPPEPGPLGAEALVAMAESFLAHGPAARKDRYLAMIHVDADVLTDDTDGRCELDDGPALSPETARRIACDNPFVAVLLDSVGKPAKVGKKTQAIPTRVKRAVRARDRGCRFPGCGQRKFTDVHHIRWRSRGGKHRLANLAELCWHHHWLVHEGGWDLVAEADGELTAIQPNGERLTLRSVSDRSRRRRHRNPQHRTRHHHRSLIPASPAGTATPSTSTTSPPASCSNGSGNTPNPNPNRVPMRD